MRRLEAKSPPGERTVERPPLAAFEVVDCVRRRPDECVEGVLLVADDEGRLVVGVAWLVRAPDDPSVDPLGRCCPLAAAEASWRSILDLVADIVCRVTERSPSNGQPITACRE